MLALEQVSVISDLKGSEAIQEQRENSQETIVISDQTIAVPSQGIDITIRLCL